MSHGRGYRFLEPAALARVKNLSLAARGVVEGFISGLHSSPYRGFSVEFAEHRKYSPSGEAIGTDRVAAALERESQSTRKLMTAGKLSLGETFAIDAPRYPELSSPYRSDRRRSVS